MFSSNYLILRYLLIKNLSILKLSIIKLNLTIINMRSLFTKSAAGRPTALVSKNHVQQHTQRAVYARRLAMGVTSGYLGR